MSLYRSVQLAARPNGLIKHGETFSVHTAPIPSVAELKDGEVILRVLYISIDPAMRGWLDDKQSYQTPVHIGEVMRAFGVGTVIGSKSQAYPEGTYVVAFTGWREIAVCHEDKLQKVEAQGGPTLTDWLGVLGYTGMTAYFGIEDIAQVKKGDVVVVSGAAGATGSIAGQIAKIKGARVVGIAGSGDKCQWLIDELGSDDALNYKADDFKSRLEAATKDLVDVFFDNVGGPILDMMLERAKPHARFIMCGAVSQHNNSDGYGLQNYLMITRMRIRMQGLIIFDYANRFPEGREALSKWLDSGLLKRKETIIKGGITEAEKALLGLYSGVNTGKLLVQVHTE